MRSFRRRLTDVFTVEDVSSVSQSYLNFQDFNRKQKTKSINKKVLQLETPTATPYASIAEKPFCCKKSNETEDTQQTKKTLIKQGE